MLLLLLLTPATTFAASATWQTNPGSGDWNTATNWMPNTVPNGADTATFGSSARTEVALSANTIATALVFNPGASAFTITVNYPFRLTIAGVGIINNSGVGQNFVATGTNTSGEIVFSNSATAGSLTVFTTTGSAISRRQGGFVQFFDTSNAADGTFTNEAGQVDLGSGGYTVFRDTSNAANGTFTNEGGTIRGAQGGFTLFYESATAGNAIITNNGGRVTGRVVNGGVTFFNESATAGNATITAHGGTLSNASGGAVAFYDTSSASRATLIANGGLNGGTGGSISFFGRDTTGGTARVKVFGNGYLDISPHNRRPAVTVGSIEGDGNVFLSNGQLIVGSNNLNTRFSGVISNGGGLENIIGGGSLGKIGRGKLVLTGPNTYRGGTTIERGKLIVNNSAGSGTGSGPVQVNGGKLGGKGTIAGPVTVGRGTGAGAFLAPGYVHGIGSPGALTIQSPLTFNSDAIYEVGMNSSSVMGDEVVALGVTINGGAQFTFVDIGSGSLPAGTVFTVINNTAATPIAGTFSNLPDGSTFTSNGNSFKANYQGGDGNDLTLKVVP